MTIRALIALLVLAVAHGAPALGNEKDKIRQERAALTDIVRNIHGIYNRIATRQSGAPYDDAISAHVEGKYTVPPGFQEMYKENASRLKTVLTYLESDKPITPEAMEDYRKALIETDAIKASLLGHLAWNIASVYTSGSNPDLLFEMNYGFDENGRIKTLEKLSLTLAQANQHVLKMIKVRVPELKVRYRLGPVTLEGKAAQKRKFERDDAVNKIKAVVEGLERAINRQETDFEAHLKTYLEKAKPVEERLKTAIKAANGNQEQIAKERHYAEIELNSLANQMEAIRPGLEKDRAALKAARARLRAAEAEARKAAYEGLPKLVFIKTKAAELVGSNDQTDEIEKIDALIEDYLDHQAELGRTRDDAMKQFKDAVAEASDAATKVSNATARSYIAQALAQTVVQLADNATHSKGNPAAFIMLASVQIVSNVTFSKPTFYDYELDKKGQPKKDAEQDRANIKGTINGSVKTSVAKFAAWTPMRELINYGGPPANPRLFGSVSDVAARSALRRATGRTLSQNLTALGSLRSNSLVGSIMEGIVIDTATEKAKASIAEELTKNEVRAYADAQYLLTVLAETLKSIYLLEEHDKKMLAGLKKRRAELEEELAKPLEGSQKIRPALVYKKNEKFEAVSDYLFIIELSSGEDHPFDFFINGVKAEPGDQVGTFTIGGAVMKSLAEGASERLELTVRLQ